MPENIIIRNNLALGDVVCSTAAIKNLCLTYPDKFSISLETHFKEVSLYNPYIHKSSNNNNLRTITIEYGHLLTPYLRKKIHIVEMYRIDLEEKIGLKIERFCSTPQLYLSDKEKNIKYDFPRPWFVLNAGAKLDMTTKQYSPENYQEIVTHFKDKVHFVQIGEYSHLHPTLFGVTDMRGKTSIRDLLCLIYHSDGVLCPITATSHIAAAFSKPCIVIAGGREDPAFEAYKSQKYLHTIGLLDCCLTEGCWKARTIKINDGAIQDSSICSNPEKNNKCKYYPKCMNIIAPKIVISAVEKYL